MASQAHMAPAAEGVLAYPDCARRRLTRLRSALRMALSDTDDAAALDCPDLVLKVDRAGQRLWIDKRTYVVVDAPSLYAFQCRLPNATTETLFVTQSTGSMIDVLLRYALGFVEEHRS